MTDDATPRILTVGERLRIDIDELSHSELPNCRFVAMLSLAVVALQTGVVGGLSWSYSQQLDAIRARVIQLEVQTVVLRHDLLAR